MALINQKKSPSKEKIKLDIDKEIYSQIKHYCAWANIQDIEHFFEEAARFIFAKDKDWKKELKTLIVK